MRFTVTAKAQILIIVAAIVILAVLMLTNVGGPSAPLPLLRLLLALALLLFIPGYALQAALFPACADLDGPQRLAVSVGLSVAIIPPVALVLDKLPWGLRAWPALVAWALLSATFLAAAWYRGRRLASDERFFVSPPASLAPRPSSTLPLNLLYAGLFLVFLSTIVSGLVFAEGPAPGPAFTEFYMLSSTGQAKDYPTQAIVGQPITVTIGITNHEGVAATYRVEAVESGRSIGEAGPISLGSGANEQRPLSFAPTSSGEDVKVDLLLYKDDDQPAYRALRLLLRVIDKS